MSRTILVTGGAGFLGSHLCSVLLEQGNHVICLDNFQTGQRRNIADLLQNPRFTLREQDVVDSVEDLTDVEEIFNLACPASPPHYQRDPVHTLETCVLGMRNMVKLANRCHAKILQASTSEIYGDPLVHPQTESYWGNVNTVGIRSCYDEGKRCAESYLYASHLRDRTRVKIIRIFNTYGPGMSPDDGRVISNFILQALRNEDITIYGDGSQTRSFCYRDDLIRGMLAMMATADSAIGPVNLGNPGEFTIRQLAELVLELTGSASRIVSRPLPPDDPRLRRPDIRRAQELLGWQPTTPLRDGLLQTIAYFQRISR